MPQEPDAGPDIGPAVRRNEAARAANEQTQEEAHESIRRLQAALQSLRSAQDESNAVTLQANETMRTALLSSLRLSGQVGGNQYIADTFQGINADFQSIAQKHSETKDPNLQTFLTIFRDFSAQYSRNLVNGAFPSDPTKHQAIAQAIIGMRKTMDAANEYVAGSLPYLTRNDDGTLAIVQDPDSGEMMERLESTLHLHRPKTELESIAKSPHLYAQWTSTQANRARKAFDSYQRITARAAAAPEDKNLASIVRFCRTKGIDAYARFVDTTPTGQRFRQDPDSLAGIENALGWLERGIQEFETVAGAVSPSVPEASQSTPPPVREAPANTDVPPPANQSTPPNAERAPERTASVPAAGRVFVRSPDTGQNNYLDPNFRHGTLHLHGYGVAQRSGDRRTWTITPAAGDAGVIEYSTDGRTWQRIGQTPPVQPSVTPPEAPPAPNNDAESTAPVDTTPPPSATPEVRPNTEVQQTGPRTLTFPAQGVTRMSYKTPTATSSEDHVFSPGTSAVDYYLYSAKQENGQWKLTLKDQQSADITLTLPSGQTVKMSLGPNATVPTTTPKTRQTPEPPAATSPETAASTVVPYGPDETPRDIRADRLRATFAPLVAQYRSVVQAGYAAHGGSMEWKLYSQRCQQQLTNIAYYFGGQDPEAQDASGWRSLLEQKDRPSVLNALRELSNTLREYTAATLPDAPPTPSAKIETQTGQPNELMAAIANARQTLTTRPEAVQQRFAALDALYTQAHQLAGTDALRLAVLNCHARLCDNFLNHQDGPAANPWTGLVDTAFRTVSLTANASDEAAFRRQLMEQANSTPVDLSLTPQQLLSLIGLKAKLDALRAAIPDQRSLAFRNGIIEAMGEHADVLQHLERKSNAQLAETKRLGWNVSVGMNDVYNPDTIDWLIATHASAAPVYGIADSSYFHLERITPVPTTRQTPSDPPPTAEVKTPAETLKDAASEPDGTRELTPEELVEFQFELLPGEVAKEYPNGSIQACSETTCRELRPAPRKDATGSTEPKAPEAPVVPEGITVLAAEREFRLPVSEPFSLTYNPPRGGLSNNRFGTGGYTGTLDGLIVDARVDGNQRIVRVKPDYTGTITLRRTRDGATTALELKAGQTNVRSAPQGTSEPRIESAPGTVTEISDMASFTREVLNSPEPVLVDFYKEPCTACDTMAPIVKRLAGQLHGRARVVKVNAELHTDIRNQYCPHTQQGNMWYFSYPSFVVFDKGAASKKHIGSTSESTLTQLLPQQRVARQ